MTHLPIACTCQLSNARANYKLLNLGSFAVPPVQREPRHQSRFAIRGNRALPTVFPRRFSVCATAAVAINRERVETGVARNSGACTGLPELRGFVVPPTLFVTLPPVLYVMEINEI